MRVCVMVRGEGGGAPGVWLVTSWVDWGWAVTEELLVTSTQVD
jgi:hypothetical protein